MPDYHVVDYDTGREADDLAAFLNAAGADGWRLRDIDLRRQDERRAIFVKGEAMAEYLVVDYDTGQSADQLEADLDGYGATGWELIHVDTLQQARRRGIMMRVQATATQSFAYRFSTNTAPPPASGNVELNNAAPALASYVYISNLTDAGTDVSNFLVTLLIGDKIYIQDQNNADDYYLFHLVGAPEPAADHVAYPVAFDERGTNDLANNATVVVSVGTNVSVGGGGGGGIPDAPTDGRTYGRKDATWNPSLAVDNDVLDGGTF